MAQQTPFEFDYDDVSITSTPPSSEHEPDHEFNVEEILAEKKIDGKIHHLVKWEGYALYKATWEPRKHIGDEMLQQWKVRKAREARNEVLPFNVAAYESDLIQRANAKKLRRRLRKVKRKRVGIEVSASDSESSEAQQENANMEDQTGDKAVRFHKWQPKDDRILLAKRALEMSFDEIQRACFPSRTVPGCRKRYGRLMNGSNATSSDPIHQEDQREEAEEDEDVNNNDRKPSARWDAQDDEILLRARAEGLSWGAIQQKYFPSRTGDGCKRHHYKLTTSASSTAGQNLVGQPSTNPSSTSASWSMEDGHLLLQARENGMSFSEIQANYFSTRTVEACKKHFLRLSGMEDNAPTREKSYSNKRDKVNDSESDEGEESDDIQDSDGIEDSDEERETRQLSSQKLSRAKWNERDDKMLSDARHKGMGISDIQRIYFPFRTSKAVGARWSLLRRVDSSTLDISSTSKPADNQEVGPDSDSSDEPLINKVATARMTLQPSEESHGMLGTPKTTEDLPQIEPDLPKQPFGRNTSPSPLTSFTRRDNSHIKRNNLFKVGVPDNEALTVVLKDTKGETFIFKFEGSKANWSSDVWVKEANTWHSKIIRRYLPPPAKIAQSNTPSSASSRQNSVSKAPAEASSNPHFNDRAASPVASAAPIRPTAAKRGGSFGLTQNVFSGGSSRKQKSSLIDQASDPSKAQKHFSNMHLQHKAHVQARNRADAPPDPDAVGGLYNPANPKKLSTIRPATLQRNKSSDSRAVVQNETNEVENESSSMHISTSPPMGHAGGITTQDSSLRVSIPTAPDGTSRQETQTPRQVATAHGLPPDSMICYFWHTLNNCKKGYSCRYMHEDIPGLPVAPAPRQTPSSLVCEFYLNGFCFKGDDCPRVHPPRSHSPRIDSPSSATNFVEDRSHDAFVGDDSMQLVDEPDPIDSPHKGPPRPKRTVSFAADPISPQTKSETKIWTDRTESSVQEKASKDGIKSALRKSVSFSDASPLPKEREPNLPMGSAWSTNKSQRIDLVCKFWTGEYGRSGSGCHDGDSCRFNHYYGEAPPTRATYNRHEDSNQRNYNEARPEAEDNRSPALLFNNTPTFDSPATVHSPAQQTIALPKAKGTKLSMDDYRKQKSLTTLGAGAKMVFFGNETTESIVLHFEGVEHALKSEWGSSFAALPNIQFNQLCAAQDFGLQEQRLISQVLWKGNTNIDPADISAGTILQNVSQQLRLIPGGLISALDDFVIVLYPPVEEWKIDSNLPNNVALRCMIFQSNVDLSQLVHAPAQENTSSQYMRTLVRSIHKLSFAKLLPKRAEVIGNSKVHVFLLFPNSANQTAKFLVSWISSSSSSKACKIYSSQTEGSWGYFVNSPSVEHGIVLVHESVIAYVSELPGLLKLLTARGDTFWYISDSGSMYPLFEPPLDSTLGQTTATRIFPHGHAILLTPSLLVANPDRALQLVRWFHINMKNRAPGTYKLVCAHGILTYLLDLALEKAKERDMFLEKYRDDPKKDAMELSAGLTWKLCQDRFHCHEEVSDLLQKDVSDGYSSYYNTDYPAESCPIVLIDSSIDPDDEKAMATWFAGWAVTKFDQFRRFTVVGTNAKSKDHAWRRKEVVELVPVAIPKLSIKPFSLIKDRPSSSAVPFGSIEEQVLDLMASTRQDPLPQFDGPSDARPQSSGSASSGGSKRSGIVSDGDRTFAPRSVRQNGTVRTEKRVRPGFTPIEDQEVHQNRRVVDGVPQYDADCSATTSPTEHPPKAAISFGVQPGMTLKAYWPQDEKGPFLGIETGDEIEITENVGAIMWSGINKRSKKQGNFYDLIFRPRPTSAPNTPTAKTRVGTLYASEKRPREGSIATSVDEGEIRTESDIERVPTPVPTPKPKKQASYSITKDFRVGALLEACMDFDGKTTNSLNLRIQKGDKIKLEELSSGSRWYGVNMRTGDRGYVYEKFLQVPSPAAPSTEKPSSKVVEKEVQPPVLPKSIAQKGTSSFRNKIVEGALLKAQHDQSPTPDHPVVHAGDYIHIIAREKDGVWHGTNRHNMKRGLFHEHIFDPLNGISPPWTDIKLGKTMTAYGRQVEFGRKISVEKGELIDIEKYISGSLFHGHNRRTGKSGQVQDILFQPPATVIEVTNNDNDTTMPDAENTPQHNEAVLPISARSPPSSQISNEMEIDEPGPVEDQDIIENQMDSEPVPTEERLVEKDIRFEPTTEWYARLKEEGKGWEHVLVEGWDNCFRALGVHK